MPSCEGPPPESAATWAASSPLPGRPRRGGGLMRRSVDPSDRNPRCGQIASVAQKPQPGNLPAIMVAQSSKADGGPVSRMRDARRRVALFATKDSPRAKLLTLAILLALTVLIAVLTLVGGVSLAPPASLALPVVLGGILLDRRALRMLLVVVAVAFIVEVANKGWDEVRPGSLILLVLITLVAIELARDRERLGLSAGRGESILLELRNQLRRQGELPALPPGWHADVDLRSAGGTAFGGDFLVSALSDSGRRLELAVVDVSGKGLDAGTRALMLSGALGGLLGAISPEKFLGAANAYLLRQEELEGFATAVHVAIDLTTGHYRLA